MSSEDSLDCVECMPAESPTHVVIWLHGLGADGHDFEPIVPYLGVDPAKHLRFVFPHAPRRPVTINGGLVMRAWYDILQMSLRRDVDEPGVLDSAKRIEALIEREHARGVPFERILLAGFSQGGAIALHVALRYPERLAGVLALSTYLVRGDELDRERSPANAAIPIFQAHGEMDPMVPLEAGRLGRDRLRELGYAVEWKTYPMGHEVHPSEIVDIAARIDTYLASA